MRHSRQGLSLALIFAATVIGFSALATLSRSLIDRQLGVSDESIRRP